MKPFNMKFLFPLLAVLCLFTCFACNSDDNTIVPAPTVFLDAEGLTFTSAYAQFERTEQPSSSRVRLRILGGNASIDGAGQYTNLPAEFLNLSLQVPNTDGEIIDGMYPVIRMLPTEEKFIGDGVLVPNFSPSTETYLEVQSGTVEVTRTAGTIRLNLDLRVQNTFNTSADERQLTGEVEIPLVIL